MSLTVSFRVINQFFDRPAVQRAVDAGSRRALSKIGAFIRRRARSSIKRRKKISQPGSPPTAHATETPNLKTILFAYDPRRQSVVVGPVAFNQAIFGNKSNRTTVPELLEKGGTQAIPEHQIGNKWFSIDLRRRRTSRPVRWRTARYAPRPFMGPALAKDRPNIPSAFKDSLKAA